MIEWQKPRPVSGVFEPNTKNYIPVFSVGGVGEGASGSEGGASAGASGAAGASGMGSAGGVGVAGSWG